MNDPVLLGSAAALAVGTLLALSASLREIARLGGAASLASRARARHDRFAARLFYGWRGAVPGRELADPSKALLAGETAALPVAACLFSRYGFTAMVPLLPLAAATILLVGRASLASQGRGALESVRQDLPGAAFLLSLLLDSGLSLGSAMPEVLSTLEGRALHRELSGLLSARTLGGDPGAAYASSMEKVREENFHAFLSILRQGERMGSGFSRSLAELADRMLEEEAVRAETRAQKAPVRLLAPLVLCFFPSVALLILSPVIVPLLSGELLP
jgi:tight adherence protein C